MKIMKQIFSLILACTMIFSLCSCGKETTSSIDDFDDFLAEDSFEDVEVENEEDSSKQTNSSQSNNSTSSKNNQIENDIKIKDTKKPLESDLNIKGKTFTIGLNAMSESTERVIKAFEQKYGCTLTPVIIDMDQYVQQVSARITAGKSLDITVVHGSNFPNVVLSELLLPLQDGMGEMDFYDSDKPSNGGIDYERSKFFSWNNNLYAVMTNSGIYSATAGGIWYNKKMLNSAGCSDPRTLYNQGKWNWDAMKTIGLKITDTSKGVYLGKSQLIQNALVPANGSAYIVYKDGQVTANLNDKKLYTALKYMQEICYGNNKIINMEDYSHNAENFFDGKIAFFNAAEYNYYSNYNIAEGVLKSNAFGKSLDNLGFVPFPEGPDKNGVSLAGPWAEGWAATKGSSNIKVCLAWAKFVSTYNDPVKPKYQIKADDQAIIDKLRTNITTFKMYGFADSTSNVDSYIKNLETAIANGGDISQNISDYNKIIENCIKLSLKQQ